MKVYSDIFSTSALYGALPHGCNIEAMTIGQPRVRKYGAHDLAVA